MIRSPFRSAAARPRPAARPYCWAALGFMALALYGSFVPFHFRPRPLPEAWAALRAIPYLPLGIESRSDWVANILLFIPLSYLVLAALCVDRPRRAGLIAAPVVVAACAALSFAIEFAQQFFPPRTVSLNDVVAESIGGLIGAALWLAWGQRVAGWLRGLRVAAGSRGLADRLLPGYLALLVLVHVMPLDLTISPAEIVHKYREGRIRPVPFMAGPADAGEEARKLAWSAAYFAPFGVLLALRRGPAPVDRREWPRVAGLGLGLAGLIEGLQLFVYTRGFDATDILVEGAVVLAAWAACVSYLRSRSQPGGPALGAGNGHLGTVLPTAALWGWTGLLVVVHWWPFDFSAGGPALAARLGEMTWVPFADYYWGTEYHAFEQCVNKALLFLPVGALMALDRPSPPSVLEAVLLAGLLAAGLELGQLFLPSHHAGMSDVLVEAWGAWLGHRAASYLRSKAASDPIRRGEVT